MLHYLRVKRPDAVRKVALYAPALPCVLADPFLNGFRDGTHDFIGFRSREDVKHIFRTFLSIDPTRKSARKDPFPKLFYEVIYRIHRRDVPEGHYKALQNSLLLGANLDPAETDRKGTEDHDSIYAATTDQDSECSRMIVWVDDDQICDAEKGRRFFGPSTESARTTFETLPSCGHAFTGDGRGVYQVIAPLVRDFLLDFSAS